MQNQPDSDGESSSDSGEIDEDETKVLRSYYDKKMTNSGANEADEDISIYSASKQDYAS